MKLKFIGYKKKPVCFKQAFAFWDEPKDKLSVRKVFNVPFHNK